MSTASAKKKLDEKHLKILKELVAHDTNKHCFDCKQRGPTYVNITIGSFVCTNCGGALRKYNHRVKSIVMSNFTTQEMDFLKRRGNEANRHIYFGLNDANFPSEMDLSDDRHLDDHLRQKYELKRWYIQPNEAIENKALALNSQIYDAVEKGNTSTRSNGSNQFARMPNASAGLILPAPAKNNLPKAIARPTPGGGTTVVNTTSHTGDTIRTQASPAVQTSDPFGSATSHTAGVNNDPFGPPLSPFDMSNSSTNGVLKGTHPTPNSNNFLSQSSIYPTSTAPNVTSNQQGFSTKALSTVTVDKYAALKELDGLFGGGPPTQSTAPAYNHTSTIDLWSTKESNNGWSVTSNNPLWGNTSSNTAAVGQSTAVAPTVNPFSLSPNPIGSMDSNPFARNSTTTSSGPVWNSTIADPYTKQAPVAPTMNPFNPFLATPSNMGLASNQATFNSTTSTNPFL